MGIQDENLGDSDYSGDDEEDDDADSLHSSEDEQEDDYGSSSPNEIEEENLSKAERKRRKKERKKEKKRKEKQRKKERKEAKKNSTTTSEMMGDKNKKNSTSLDMSRTSRSDSKAKLEDDANKNTVQTPSYSTSAVESDYGKTGDVEIKKR